MNSNHAQDRLHQLFAEDPLDESNVPAPDHNEHDEVDEVINLALAATDLSVLSSEAQELLIGLTETASSLDPLTRQRLVGAADRGMKRRREDTSPLPRLLFVVRNREHQSLEMVAASLSADNAMLLQIERGERDIRDLGPDGVASWIRHFGVSTDIALEALRLTFVYSESDRAAASTPTELSDEHDRFVRQVSKLLQQT